MVRLMCASNHRAQLRAGENSSCIPPGSQTVTGMMKAMYDCGILQADTGLISPCFGQDSILKTVLGIPQIHRSPIRVVS